MKKYNIIMGILFLLLAIGAYIIADGMVAKLATDPLGPGFWPRCLAIVLGIFSIILLLQGLLKKPADDVPSPFHFKSPEFRRVALLAGDLSLFLVITYFVGIYIGLLLMIPTCMYLLGERKVKVMAIFSVASCLFIYVVFKMLLMVPLPTGILFP